jgi:hypothetical protein
MVCHVGKGFSWSASRHNSFESCERRYYYAYYGANEDPEIKRLKDLSALPLWAGSVVHEAIERFLKGCRSEPTATEEQALVHATVHNDMVSQWRESEAGGAGFRLFEHEYQVPVEYEDKKIAVDIVRGSLRAFFRSPTLAEALAAGRERWLSVEDLVSFHVGEIEVYLRMDLAFRNREGRVVIVDWKTGRSERPLNALQVAGYALFAAERGWAESPEEIETELAYLAIPRFVRRGVDGATLDEARAFVQKSASAMKALLVDPVKNEARIEDFKMVDRPQLCRRCNFRRLCFPRASADAAGAVDARRPK